MDEQFIILCVNGKLKELKYLLKKYPNINVHSENEISWEPRMQMMIATGNMVISERITTNPYLVPGRDYIEISSPQEMHDIAKYYLEHETERDEIAVNGMEKVQTLFDSKKMFTIFINNLNANKYNKVSICRPHSNFIVLELFARFKKIIELCKRFF